jgi:xanthine dehydrogenase YagR molybdenum-binding subunit
MTMGQSIDRQDGRRKVLGLAKYAAEASAPEMAYAVLVQSTIAAGTIAGFDIGTARGMPGVLDIMTTDNAEKLHLDGGPKQVVRSPLLQSNDVLYNGQHVAVVTADTLRQAQAAAARVVVRYKPAEAVIQMESALNQAHPPKQFDNGRSEADTKVGDPDSAMSTAAVKVEATYVTPVEHHNPMEPHATIAVWDGDRLTVRTATQGISGAQDTLAALFGLPKENVTVICPFVGGGFGCKGSTWPPATLTAMAARRVNRPVKLELTRRQMYTSNGFRARTIQKFRLGADADGKLMAVSCDGLAQTSQPQIGEFAEAVGLSARMMYACPNIATTHRLINVNQGLPTFMRAPGEASGNFGLESAMDELAAALNIDPIELRLRNYTDKDPTTGKPFASKGLRECYQRGAEAFGWGRRTPVPGSMRDGNVLIGLGMATTSYPTNRMPASALVRYQPDGSVLVMSGTQDIGTGTYTTMAQIAADELGLPIERVQAQLGDSRMPPAPVSGGSMTSASVLPAVRDAAAQVRDRIFALTGWNAGDLRLENGVVRRRSGQVNVTDLIARAGGRPIEATAQAKPADDAKNYARHAFGAQFAEVRIDPDLRTIKVSRWVGAFDCGRLINAKTGRSQLIGGIVFGIGMALMEETRIDPELGRIVNANIADYLVPVNADIPDIETIVVEAPDTVTTPLGIKGIGELPTVGVAAAIANAVYHATGTRVRELPVRLDKLLV